MKKLIDLSLEILDDMPVHPYDDKVRLYQDKYLDKDEYVNHKLEIGMHSGTHIDAPMHLIESDTFICEIPLDKFAGRGVLLDVRNEAIIKYKNEYDDIVRENDIVLLFTGHSNKFGTASYYSEYPVIADDLADFFIEKKIKMLGMDLPSPDYYPFEIHKKLFKNNILIIENLTNLSELSDAKNIYIIAFPLKIRAEASLVRVAAWIDE
mgnify:CR=1 FL=1